MNLPYASFEQNNIIEELKCNKNIIVDSVAGCGKTTTNMYIAQSMPQLNILLLTYNKRLKMETREKVKQLGITNLETHTYHSFCVRYYDRKCFNDRIIKELLNNKQTQQERFKYDIIILDEAQDINDIYYELICKIYKDNKIKAQICLLGDRNQCIYNFKGMDADSRYIVYAEQLFKYNNLYWSNCKLSQSFRVTKEIATFINECMLKFNRIVSNKITNNKPTYIICNIFDVKMLYEHTIEKYMNCGYKAEDIFILAPSIKSNSSPVKRFENIIIKRSKYPVYVPTSDDERIEEAVIRGKIVFSTFHQAKGLERKIVFVFGFDDSYFKFYKKEYDVRQCPNELYVATTRASEHLILLHDYRNNYLNFIDDNKIKTLCDLHIFDEKNRANEKIKHKNINTPVTDLLRHISQEIILECIKYLKIEHITQEDEFINIPIQVEDKNGHENVYEINGVAIPAWYEFTKVGSTSIGIIPESIPDLLQKTIKYCADCSGYKFKTKQITKYDWITEANLNKCIERLAMLGITKEAKFEESHETEDIESGDYRKLELSNRRLCGRIDCIDNNNIYEFKCTKTLEYEHILQLAIYMYMYETKLREEPINEQTDIILNNYYLFNILTNELIKISCNFKALVDMMDYLIKMKLMNTKECDDTTFIEKVTKTMDIYFPHSVSVAKAQNTNKIDITTKSMIEPKAIIKTKDSSKVKTKPKKVKKSYISAKENTDEPVLKVKKIIKKFKKTNIETEKETKE